MANSGASQGQLSESLQRLHQQWQESRSLWNDPVSRSFEKEYWTPLESQTQAALAGMERLAQVMAQARRSVK